MAGLTAAAVLIFFSWSSPVYSVYLYLDHHPLVLGVEPVPRARDTATAKDHRGADPVVIISVGVIDGHAVPSGGGDGQHRVDKFNLFSPT